MATAKQRKREAEMCRYNERSYSANKALKRIGSEFWGKYQTDLLVYAKDRTKTDIPEKIHADWDGLFHWPSFTDRRIEWAIALYEHGDWPGLMQDEQDEPSPTEEPTNQTNAPAAMPPKVPSPQKQTSKAKSEPNKKKAAPPIEKKCSNCRYLKNEQLCGHGGFGPCEDWAEATQVEDYWPTWEDMKRAEHEDYRSRYREL